NEGIKALNLPLDNIEKGMPDRLKEISNLRKFFGEINKNIKQDKAIFEELKDRWIKYEYDLNQLTIRCINVCSNFKKDEALSSIDKKRNVIKNGPIIEDISKGSYSKGREL
ncbi:MAG: hypothetical protein J6Y29_05535, partial [Clostridiales bacterium]|nr:hypothetical protein [Clostridiales bacterium]